MKAGKRTGAFLVTGGLALASVAAAPAARPTRAPTEAELAAQAIESTLQRHGKDVHRCFEKALADSLDAGGKVEIEAEVGTGGKVMKAHLVNRAADVSPALSGCVLAAAASWTVEGIEPGASVVLPFAFQGQMNQFVVKSADVPERGPGVGPAGKGAAPKKAPPFTVKVLADGENVRATQVSLTLLTVGPASRVAMHRHPRSAKALYVVKGHARLLGPGGTQAQKLTEGTAVFVPAGYPHVIENMGRQAPVVFLQAFVPPGPERVYRDPRNVEARADFEVIRDPGKATAPPESNGKLAAIAADSVQPLAVAGGKTSARIVLDPKVTGSEAFALDILEFAPGAQVERHTHAGSAELLYLLSGGGKVTVGSETVPVSADDVVHVPADQPHAFTNGGEKTIAVQIYAPAGPEQRFRGAAAGAGTNPTPAKAR